MIDNKRYEELVAMAGVDGNWGGRFAKDSAVVAGITAYLLDTCGDVCAACGEAREDDEPALVLCHLVSATGTDGKRRGYVFGNLFLGHVECNAADNARFTNVPLSAIARPDLIPTSGPSASECKRVGMAARQARQAASAARQARRDAARGL